MAFIIAELSESDLAMYKALILQGLRQDSECFRITPEDEENAPFPTTDQRDNFFTLGAFHDDQLVGVASFKRD